ncbi:MAG: hypothetical protein M3Q69_02015 [Acidobacteriota bacterium]|nr:hypothetical protein [Acidobacteriota bacterium]
MDRDGCYTGVDDAAFLVGGALGGWALEYAGPPIAGALGGGATNLTRQLLRNLSGKQCGYSALSFAAETALGGAFGLVPGANIPGVTTGRNSYNVIFKHMTTKLENGTIENVTGNTAAKMVIGRFAESGVPTGVPIQSGAGAAIGESANGGCGCP